MEETDIILPDSKGEVVWRDEETNESREKQVYLRT